MAGLVRSRPLVGVSLAFALLCLAGLPPGVVGLVAKVVIFQSAVDGHLGWLAVVMVVNVAIGLVYYLRFVAVLLRPAAGSAIASGQPGMRSGAEAGVERIVLAATLAASVLLSIVPGPLFSAVYR
jgi:NADH-quinone oxidoreductase subunit N